MYINLITIDLCPGQNGGGITPAGTLTISKNGMYNVYPYSSASVDVHPSESLSETYLSNGSYTITGEFNGGMITVNVPSPQFVTEPLSVSANGTYTPGEGVDGYSQVVVDVPVGFTQQNVTEGTIEIINLDNSASFVASSVFANDQNIQTVNLPYATTVGNSAFYSCNSLSQLSLPMCIRINNSAFYNCSSLTQVSLPVCSYIGNSAFCACGSLREVNLPMCSIISTAVFGTCGSLREVNLPMCSMIGNSAFSFCSSLRKLDLPVCSYIGNNAFWYCYSLSQVSLPMCSIISANAFKNCSSLTQVDLPVCSYIGNNAFSSCISLSIITIGYSSVCSLAGSNAFTNTPIASGTGSIYVTASLVDAYKSAENWSYYSNQILPISE